MSPAAEQPPRDESAPGGWTRARQDVAIVLWPSFLVAAAGTMLFFAAVDPLSLVDGGAAELAPTRNSGYAAGFFFFWLLTATASALSLYLARTQRAPPAAAREPPARQP